MARCTIYTGADFDNRPHMIHRSQQTTDVYYQRTTATTPMKRTKYDDLTDYEKTVNKTISARRSAVERCIAHLKNWKILATGYRGRLSELPNVIRIIVRLEFYRLGW